MGISFKLNHAVDGAPPSDPQIPAFLVITDVLQPT